MTDRGFEVGDVAAERYRIDDVLGRGGMGAVYRAYDLSMRRRVAVKVLAPALRGHRTPNLRMTREAFATARVAHPNCVTVLDSGALADGSVFLAMELLDGHDLASELRCGPIALDRALSIAAGVLRGLEHAHAAGVIHRDIKPANIFMARTGNTEVAKILDFGIAKLVGDARAEVGAETLTQEGLAIGSPVYMSPEQAIGNPLDARSDLYSLSVVLFEMLAGAPPFDDDDKIAVLRMHLARPAPRLAEVAGRAFAPKLEALIARGLAKDPAARPRSAAEYVAAIEGIRMPAPATVRAPTPVPVVAAAAATGAETAAETAAGAGAGVGAATRRRSRWWIAAVAALGLLAALGLSAATEPTDAAPAAAAAPAAGSGTETAAETATAAAAAAETEAETADADPDADADADPAADPAPDADPDPAAAIVALLDARRHRAADRASRALVKRRPRDARAHLARGHVYMDRMWWRDGFASYRKAISLDPSLRADPRVIANAVRALSSRSKPWLAERFIREHLGELARGELERARASRSRNLSRRAARLLAQIR